MYSLESLDKFELIATHARDVVTILGNAAGEYELIPLHNVAATLSKVKDDLLARGFRFVGVIGLMGGTVQPALDVPLDTPTIAALCASYSHFIEERNTDRVRATGPGDSLKFLEALWAQHDPRPDA
jgi:hypothetical protein